MKQYENIEQQLAEEGQIVTVLHGVSMWPMIRNRKDPVLLLPIDGAHKKAMKPGDVVAYSKGNRFVVHRVLRYEQDFYTIVGDNCKALEMVHYSDLIAVMVGFWRNGKYVDMRSCWWYRLYVRFYVNGFMPLRRLF